MSVYIHELPYAKSRISKFNQRFIYFNLKKYWPPFRTFPFGDSSFLWLDGAVVARRAPNARRLRFDSGQSLFFLLFWEIEILLLCRPSR